MRNEIKSVLENLKKTAVKVQSYLDRTENEDRQAELENELESIEAAIEALENID